MHGTDTGHAGDLQSNLVPVRALQVHQRRPRGVPRQAIRFSDRSRRSRHGHAQLVCHLRAHRLGPVPAVDSRGELLQLYRVDQGPVRRHQHLHQPVEVGCRRINQSLKTLRGDSVRLHPAPRCGLRELNTIQDLSIPSGSKLPVPLGSACKSEVELAQGGLVPPQHVGVAATAPVYRALLLAGLLRVPVRVVHVHSLEPGSAAVSVAHVLVPRLEANSGLLRGGPDSEPSATRVPPVPLGRGVDAPAAGVGGAGSDRLLVAEEVPPVVSEAVVVGLLAPRVVGEASIIGGVRHPKVHEDLLLPGKLLLH
mmetsp:Transcript_19224/g.48827  ORF Transcript_19224/g.48827 Transcript_19224/m.48827 type:complete len:309 (-) Transcript_19224:1009-1935(-)